MDTIEDADGSVQASCVLLGCEMVNVVPSRWFELRLLIFLVVAGLAASACSSDAVESSVADGTVGSSEVILDDSTPLEAWCASQTVDRCVEGYYLLYSYPGEETCVFSSILEEPLFVQCPQPSDLSRPTIPSTTDPTPESIEDDERRAIEVRSQFLADVQSLTAELSALLAATHPNGTVSTSLVPIEPLTLAAADNLVAELGGDFDMAWRTDYVCLPGEGVPPIVSTRTAYRDGVERAVQQRREAVDSELPVTGFFFLSDSWARMDQAARSLQEPGVLVEALTASIPVSSLHAAHSRPDLRAAWIGITDPDLLQLSDEPEPACDPVSNEQSRSS